MTTKHEIEIPSLPEGWRAAAYRRAIRGKDNVLLENSFGESYIQECDWDNNYNYLIVEKIKPRRIVLELTDKDHNSVAEDGEFILSSNHDFLLQKDGRYGSGHVQIWRVVEEE